MSRIKSAQESVIEQKALHGIIPRGKTAIVVIYTLFGPAVGGLITISVLLGVAAAAGGFGAQSEFVGSPIELWFWLPAAFLFGVFYGYIFGGAQALVCGLLLAAVSDLNGRFSYAQAAIASMIVAILSAALIFVAIDDDVGNAVFMVAAGPPTSLLLRWIFRKWFSRNRAT